MDPSSNEFIPVHKRRSRSLVPKRNTDDNFEHSKFTAKRGKSRSKPSTSGAKGRPNNETQNVHSNIIGRAERHRNAGGHLRRCICRWIMTYGRWLDPYEFVMNYNDGQGCPICRVKFPSEDCQSDHFDMHAGQTVRGDSGWAAQNGTGLHIRN